MSDSERNALTFPCKRGLEQANIGAKKLISVVVSDALTIASHYQFAEARIKLGSYELNESSYQQVLIWADAAQKRPDEFINILAQVKDAFWDGTSFMIDNGAITQVAFPPHLLLNQIDLSKSTFLTRLKCDQNGLDAIELSNVYHLRELYCQFNKIEMLDISKVAKLEILACAGNRLTEIDMSSTPDLEGISCGWNNINHLNLPANLFNLQCRKNKITEIDLSHCPKLRFLECDPDVKIIRGNRFQP